MRGETVILFFHILAYCDTVEKSPIKIFTIEGIHNDYFDSASKTVCEMCNYTYNTTFNKSRDRSVHWLKTHFRQKFHDEIGEKMKISFPKCPFGYCDFRNTQSSETHLKMHIFCTHGLQKKYFYEEMKYRKEFELKTTFSIKAEQNHSSEKSGLCLMKSSSKALQNLAYFIYTKTQSCFFHFSFRATLFFR